MAYSPPHDFQMLETDPACEEKMYFDDFDDSWKSGSSGLEDSNSLSDCVPTGNYGCNPNIGSDPNFGNVNEDSSNWQKKHPQQWNPLDVMMWIQYTADFMRLIGLMPETFADIDGSTLCKMQMEQFQEREPSYGDALYNALNQLIYQTPHHQPTMAYAQPPAHNYEAPDKNLLSIGDFIHMNNISFDKDDTFPSLPPFDQCFTSRISAPAQQNKPIKEEKRNYEDDPPSPVASESSSTDSDSVCVPKARRGRSKGKLWEFVLNLLLGSETNPSIIKWEDRSQGVFRIVRSDQVAKLWGVRKSNPSMTYEKMSRAMRYYYRKKILERIDGRRLVYKFGPSSRGWQL